VVALEQEWEVLPDRIERASAAADRATALSEQCYARIWVRIDADMDADTSDKGSWMVVGGAWQPIRPVPSEDLPLRDGTRIGDSVEWLRWDDSETERRQRAAEALKLDLRRTSLSVQLGPIKQQRGALEARIAELGSPEEQQAFAAASTQREAVQQRRVAEELRQVDLLRTRAQLDEARERAATLKQHLAEVDGAGHAER
jgi:hypothetical protein